MVKTRKCCVHICVQNHIYVYESQMQEKQTSDLEGKLKREIIRLVRSNANLGPQIAILPSLWQVSY